MPSLRLRTLPQFPWDRLAPYTEKAARHPDGAVNLSVGTPVDPVPEPIQQALRDNADRPGYPTVAGTPRLRNAMTGWVRRHCHAGAGIGVLPTIGSKELVAGLPGLLGLGPDDLVAIPEHAYPTYEVGALLTGARCVRTDDPTEIDDPALKLIWLNYPNNPTGAVIDEPRLRDIVTWARQREVLVASDECYLALGWEREPISILHAEVSGQSQDGVLAVHSLSKRSNLAGYRAGFVAGDALLLAHLHELRRHAGFMVPGPVQAAMTAALCDEEHATEQRERYRRRREILRDALTGAGFRIDHSQAGLYLWATRDEDCWDTVDALAGLGIVVAPGEFYGPTGGRHVRVALTATDERVDAAALRLASWLSATGIA